MQQTISQINVNVSAAPDQNSDLAAQVHNKRKITP